MIHRLANVLRGGIRRSADSSGVHDGLSSASVLAGTADFSSEVRDAIEAARLSVREPTDDGPRVAVISDDLRGAFIFSKDEARRRLKVAFPELSEHGVSRALRHLQNRVRLRLNPPGAKRQRSWVHGWKED